MVPVNSTTDTSILPSMHPPTYMRGTPKVWNSLPFLMGHIGRLPLILDSIIRHKHLLLRRPTGPVRPQVLNLYLSAPIHIMGKFAQIILRYV